MPDEGRELRKRPLSELRLALAVTAVAAWVRGASWWWVPAFLGAVLAGRALGTRTPVPPPPVRVEPRAALAPRPSSSDPRTYYQEAQRFASAGLHRLREELPAGRS
ncbi:MAG: hypothetical protein K8T20_12555 [Planctomycetes bacterium]|nr:hypothetical protein [Planctomycetota bacterium]